MRGVIEGIFPIFQWSPDTGERLFRQAVSGWTTKVFQLRTRMTLVVRFAATVRSELPGRLPRRPRGRWALDSAKPEGIRGWAACHP